MKSRSIVLGVSGAVLLTSAATLGLSTSNAAQQTSLATSASGEAVVCAHKTTGALRLPKPGKKCKKTEKPLTMNLVGPAGSQGPAGETGATGAAGAAGLAGPAGSQGEVGASGPTGDAGPQGPAGPVGPAGPQGDPGAPGADGVNGPSILDGNGDTVPGAFLNGGVQLLADGVVWYVGWDGRVSASNEGGDIFADDQCSAPVYDASTPAQAAVTVQGRQGIFRLEPTPLTGLRYVEQGIGGCMPIGESTYWLVDLDSPITKPADLAGPLTVALD